MEEVYREVEQPYLREYGIEFFLQKATSQGVLARAHVHPAIEFIYVSSGAFEVGVDSEQFTANAGDLVLLRANAVHTTRLVGAPEGEYFVLKINPSLLFQMFQGKDSTEFVIPFIQKSPLDRSHFSSDEIRGETKAILDAMIEELNCPDRLFFSVERSYAARLLVSLLRTLIEPRSPLREGGEISEKSVALIHESVKYINENYAADITPADCAANIHLSYSYFAKLFRAVMGKTFKEYLTGVRLAKAHNVLLSTFIPITDVAAACGYSNLSYFISEYKKVYGKTPRDTRKTVKAK